MGGYNTSFIGGGQVLTPQQPSHQNWNDQPLFFIVDTVLVEVIQFLGGGGGGGGKHGSQVMGGAGG